MADVAQRLAEAEAALHLLLLGQSATLVTAEGYSTQFKPADEGRLRAYIAELRGAPVQRLRFSTSKGLC